MLFDHVKKKAGTGKITQELIDSVIELKNLTPAERGMIAGLKDSLNPNADEQQTRATGALAELASDLNFAKNEIDLYGILSLYLNLRVEVKDVFLGDLPGYVDGVKRPVYSPGETTLLPLRL